MRSIKYNFARLLHSLHTFADCKARFIQPSSMQKFNRSYYVDIRWRCYDGQQKDEGGLIAHTYKEKEG